MSEHDLNQMQDREDEAYLEQELRCGSCGGLMDTCALGDGIHGMYCELHNVACEYEARCDKLDKEGEGE